MLTVINMQLVIMRFYCMLFTLTQISEISNIPIDDICIVKVMPNYQIFVTFTAKYFC